MRLVLGYSLWHKVKEGTIQLHNWNKEYLLQYLLNIKINAKKFVMNKIPAFEIKAGLITALSRATLEPKFKR